MNPARVPAVYLTSAFSWFLSRLLFPRITNFITPDMLQDGLQNDGLGGLGCEPKPVRFFRIRNWKSHDSALSESAQVFIAYILHSRAGLVFPSSGCEPKPVRFFQSVGPSGIPRNDAAGSTPKRTFCSPHSISGYRLCQRSR